YSKNIFECKTLVSTPIDTSRYLLLTFVLNVITILVTVIIINVYFRGPTTHRMPAWVRKLFLEWMPCVMCMQRPKSASRKLLASQKRGVAQLPGLGQFTFNPATHHPFCPSADDRTASMKVLNSSTEIERDPATAAYYPLSPDALRAIDAIEYITDHLKQDEEYKMNTTSGRQQRPASIILACRFVTCARSGSLCVACKKMHKINILLSIIQYRDDWKYVAMIIDRLLLYVFFGITVGGTCGILFSAPYVFQGVNQREVLQRLIELYKSGGSRS
ncbi:Neurotransmitter-gated ion-channel transmembrane region, partial [Ancylostoma caninum]